MKIVIGSLEEEETIEMATLPEDLATRFENLTHLHLWGIRGLKTLPPLPTGLKCLDVRKCPDLQRVPCLPDTLETLDFDGCGALAEVPKHGPSGLRRIAVDECVSFPASWLNRWLVDADSLEEVSAKNCPQIVVIDLPKQSEDPPELKLWEHPASPAGRLKKLVIEGCSGLVKLPEMSGYRWLHHLNVNRCSSLADLPRLAAETGDPDAGPTGIRYLLTHGCESLRHYGELDYRPVHASKDETTNAAPVLRTMERLAETATDLVMAKLLLLGSGRCGKTTTAKALQWYALPQEKRANDPNLDPTKDQESTVNLQFWRWDMEFWFEGKGKQKSQRGTLHLWDFGGQELYHNTHRLFASQGSVFVLVTTHPDIHDDRVSHEAIKIGDTSDREDYFRENEYRELKYWLDYLRNALGLGSLDHVRGASRKVSILVIHTFEKPEDETNTGYLLDQAGPYRYLLETHQIKVVAMNYRARDAETKFEAVKAWVRERSGRAADEYGVRVPGVFARTAERCGDLLADPAGEQILSFAAWRDLVASEAPRLMGATDQVARLKQEQAVAVAEYLHQCGRIFWLRPPNREGEIIVNQQWGVDLIYALTRRTTAKSLQELGHRLFGGDEFRAKLREKCPLYKQLSPERQALLMDLLDQCNVCVRVGDDVWMAVQREVLPEADPAMEERLLREWMTVANQSGRHTNHSFAIHGDQGGLLGNSDYRELVAYVARRMKQGMPGDLFGDDLGRSSEKWDIALEDHPLRGMAYGGESWFWRNGFMVKLSKGPTRETLVLRVEFAHRAQAGKQSRSFEGGIFIQFLTPDEDTFVPRLRSFLFEGDGPLAFFKDKVKEADYRAPNLARESMANPRGFGVPGWQTLGGPFADHLRHDVAISYRSTEKVLAMKIREALRLANLTVYEYADDARPDGTTPDGGSKITEIYDYLKFSRVFLSLPSKNYLKTPDLGKKENLYCPVELAEAILAAHGYSEHEQKRFHLSTKEVKRSAGRFFWVIGKQGFYTDSEIESRVPELLKEYFEKVTKPRKPDNPQTHLRTEIRLREERSIEQCDVVKMRDFLNEAGSAAKRSVRIDPDTGEGLDELVDRIQRSLEAQ